jgi:hypothetical protein
MHGPQHSDTGAEAAVAVAERGLAAWREAKAAWLSDFASFVADEARSLQGDHRPDARHTAG